MLPSRCFFDCDHWRCFLIVSLESVVRLKAFGGVSFNIFICGIFFLNGDFGEELVIYPQGN